MPFMSSRERRRNNRISSSRFRNSGRNAARTASITAGAGLLDIGAVRQARQRLAAEVRGQHDEGVAEIDRAALPVGQPAVIEHLQAGR